MSISPFASRELRQLFRRPEGITESVRWLFGCLAVSSLALTLPPVLSTARGAFLALGVAATLALVVSWILGYLTKRVLLVFDVVDAVAITALALAAPQPAFVLGITFGAVWYRALYGSTGRSFARAALYASALFSAVLLWPFAHEGTVAPPASAVLGALPTLFLTVIVARQLGVGLREREQGKQRDQALATMGAKLLGVTDLAAIRDLEWAAMTQICAASPGLRILRAVRGGSVLRVERAAGRFQTIPVTLTGDAAPDAQALDQLNAAVGTALVWDCITLTGQQGDAWLLVGGRTELSSAVALSVDNLVNQVSLALRNSEVHRQLTALAQLDALTGLENRASFTTTLSLDLAHSAGPGGLYVLFLDLDDFKDVNDVLGHRAGDVVLVEVAERLRSCTRAEDVCSRLGGDEFAVLLRGTTASAAAEIAERMVVFLAEPIDVGDQTVRIGASVGVAQATPGIDIDALVHHADVAMYASKARGKGRMHVFDSEMIQVGAPTTASTASEASAGGTVFTVGGGRPSARP